MCTIAFMETKKTHMKKHMRVIVTTMSSTRSMYCETNSVDIFKKSVNYCKMAKGKKSAGQNDKL